MQINQLQTQRVSKHTDIFNLNPKAVREHISEATNQIIAELLSEETRNKFFYAYSKFCEAQEIFWKRPYYEVDEKIPLILTAENVELIINKASQNTLPYSPSWWKQTQKEKTWKK